MKKYVSPVEGDEKKYIKSKRIIDLSEWSDFNKRMEEVNEEYLRKNAKSIKSANEVYFPRPAVRIFR